MKDRFKFRAWDIQSKKFVFYLQINARGELCAEDFMTESECLFKISQCTGLKDKNGKLIYEGDVVIWNDGHGECELNAKEGWIRKSIVKFDPIYNLELTEDTPSGEPFYKFGYWNFIYKDSEKFLKVIGNIYENPELLTKSK